MPNTKYRNQVKLKRTDGGNIEQNRLQTLGSQSKLVHSIPNYSLSAAFSICMYCSPFLLFMKYNSTVLAVRPDFNLIKEFIWLQFSWGMSGPYHYVILDNNRLAGEQSLQYQTESECRATYNRHKNNADTQPWRWREQRQTML